MRGGFRLNRAISGGATNLIGILKCSTISSKKRLLIEHDNIMNMTILDGSAFVPLIKLHILCKVISIPIVV